MQWCRFFVRLQSLQLAACSFAPGGLNHKAAHLLPAGDLLLEPLLDVEYPVMSAASVGSERGWLASCKHQAQLQVEQQGSKRACSQVSCALLEPGW